MKSISNIFAIFFSCMLGLTSQTEAQEEQSQQPDAQQQEEEKDIPVITPTLLCLMRRIWTSSWKNSGNT